MRRRHISTFDDFTMHQISEIHEIVDETRARFARVEDISFVRESSVIAQRLPTRLRQFVARCVESDVGLIMIRTSAVYNEPEDPTPPSWTEPTRSDSVAKREFFFALVASLCGHIFGWQTQQNGTYMHSILPMPEYENEQIGFSSREELSWHTEDAFHEHRCDYLSLYCLRNPRGVATVFCSSFDLDLPESVSEVLRGQHFAIVPDNSHKPERNTIDRNKFDNIERMLKSPDKIAILHGPRDRPYLRIDPDYARACDGGASVSDAYAHIVKEINRKVFEVVLSPGDICFINNDQMVHGRRSFVARYDGTERWLKRLNLIKNLNRSRCQFIGDSRLVR